MGRSFWRLRVYRRRTVNRKQAWGWQLIAPNGKKVAASCEGFHSMGNAQRNARLTSEALAQLV